MYVSFFFFSPHVEVCWSCWIRLPTTGGFPPFISSQDAALSLHTRRSPAPTTTRSSSPSASGSRDAPNDVSDVSTPGEFRGEHERCERHPPIPSGVWRRREAPRGQARSTEREEVVRVSDVGCRVWMSMPMPSCWIMMGVRTQNG
jgi:hypothetical protein